MLSQCDSICAGWMVGTLHESETSTVDSAADYVVTTNSRDRHHFDDPTKAVEAALNFLFMGYRVEYDHTLRSALVKMADKSE